jgi:hypothetical protein
MGHGRRDPIRSPVVPGGQCHWLARPARPASRRHAGEAPCSSSRSCFRRESAIPEKTNPACRQRVLFVPAEQHCGPWRHGLNIAETDTSYGSSAKGRFSASARQLLEAGSRARATPIAGDFRFHRSSVRGRCHTAHRSRQDSRHFQKVISLSLSTTQPARACMVECSAPAKYGWFL